MLDGNRKLREVGKRKAMKRKCVSPSFYTTKTMWLKVSSKNYLFWIIITILAQQ